jgi:hypothetical protein
MYKSKITFGIACMTLLLAGTASVLMGGQMGGMMGRAPQPRGFFNPIVGSGAVYEITTTGEGGNKKMTTEVDVVGKESVDGKDGYWFESTVSGTQMGDIVMKMLIVPDPNSTGPTKMIMQMPGKAPMEMPMGMGRGNQQKPQSTDIRSEAEDLGVETVTTPAGTFEAHHYKMKDQSGDSWISEKVAPYGLIKHQGKDSTMILTKVVTDAKDKITGTPVPFNPMMMGMGGRGPE